MTTLEIIPATDDEAIILSSGISSSAAGDNLPARDAEMSIQASYLTHMNGLMVDVESYGILGYMIINKNDIVMKNEDFLFITAEPRNIAPLEILTVYHSGKPYITVFDWGKNSRGYHKIADLDSSFLDKYLMQGGAPNGQGVHSICFQNYYNRKLQANQVLFLENKGIWREVYTSTDRGMPAPATPGSASGWAVFEYKRAAGSSAAWAKVPYMLGIYGVQLMDKNGKWFVPGGSQTRIQERAELMPYYKRAFANSNGTGYVNK